MAKIQLNGKKTNLQKKTSISELISKFKLNSKNIAVELNGRILPKNRYKVFLKDKDKIEIVHFIGGG